MTLEARQQRWKVILAFASVYIFWGSTYLGIRIAVGQVPPVLMAGARFLIAGPFMLAFCALSGRRIRASRRDLIKLAIIGLLLLSVSNGILCWAELWVPSGLAALIVSATPLWFLVLETWVLPGEHQVSPRALAGLGLGIVGIIILLWPELRHSGEIGRREMLGCMSLLGGMLAWAVGSLLSKRWQPRVDPFTGAGWEMTFAGLANVLFGLVLGEHHRAIWSPRGIAAIFYLVVFGSWVGFTAYIWLLKHVPTAKLTTYAYVNPVIAVFLGWLVLHEQVTGFILAGTAVVLLSVSLVTGAELKTRVPAEAQAEVPAGGPGD